MGKKDYKLVEAANARAHLRPGRHACGCQARVHALVRNCLGCGRVVCEQEGSGPCFYCGRLVCTREEREIIEKKDKRSLQLLRTLLNDPTLEAVDLAALNSCTTLSLSSLGKSIEAANEFKQKLLKADRDQEVTKVNDLQADYFSLEQNPYLTSAEREAIVRRKEELRVLSLQAKRNILVDVDVASGAMKEQKQEPIESVDDPILQSILANSVARNVHLKGTMDPSGEGQGGEQPLIDTFLPKYAEEASGVELSQVSKAILQANGELLRAVNQRPYCVALRQPLATELVLSTEDCCRFIPWRHQVDYRGPVLIGALADDAPVECFNGTLPAADGAKAESKTGGAIVGKATLFDCVTWSEFNHERASLPAFRPLSDFFVLLLSECEALPTPIAHNCASEFFQVDASMLATINAALLTTGAGIFDAADPTMVVR